MGNGNFNRVFDAFMLYLKERKKVSLSTQSAYKTDLKKFIQYISSTYGMCDLDELNKSILMSYMLHLKNNGKAATSITRTMSVLKSFFQFCYQEQFMQENLAEQKLDLPKEEKKLPEILTVEEVNVLLSQPEDTLLGIRDKAMLEILYTSGLKVNELLELKLKDINLKLKTLKCHTTDKQRILPLGSIAHEAVERYIKESRIDLNSEQCEYLFLSYNGSKISRQGFWKVVKKYATQAGIDKNITTSTFRHSFATHMIQNGIHKEVLKEALGNSSVASVQMYLDLNRKRQQIM